MENLVMTNQEFWIGKKVLITGHTGFKGSWLLILLNKLGAKVYGLSLEVFPGNSLYAEINNSKSLCEDFFIDINNREKLSKCISDINPEIVFHLAAQPLVRESYKDPINTWSTNLMGSLNLLDSLMQLKKLCTLVMITTDKVYKNKEWIFGYRENDELGGYDPYSASKAACEIAISSWRDSFCSKGKEGCNLKIASARSGNVIGGGDWSKDRIFPDAIKALQTNKEIIIRNPESTRPWQHVLDPLSGYLTLAEKLYKSNQELDSKSNTVFASPFNFGPEISSNRTVEQLVNEIIKYWPGTISKEVLSESLHEAEKLNLQIDKSFHLLQWKSKWDFQISVKRTVDWYYNFTQHKYSAYDLCVHDIDLFINGT